MNTRFTLGALALAGLLAACSDNTTGPTGSSYQLSVYTKDGDRTRNLLSVGDTGVAVLFKEVACPGGTGTCLSADAFGDFASSDSNVVSLHPIATTDGQGQTREGHLVRLVARAVGSAQISSSGRAVRVDVVATPLPLDSVRARLNPLVSYLAAVTDASGNVVSVTAAVGQVLDLRTFAFRDGDSTAYLPGVVTSKDPSVAVVQVDSTADTYLAGDAWAARQCWGCTVGAGRRFTVHAMLPGTDSVIVTARDRRYAFAVKVQ